MRLIVAFIVGCGLLSFTSHSEAHQADVKKTKASHSHGKADRKSAKHSATGKTKKIAVGEKVPDFEVTINGKKLKLSQLQKDGKLSKDGVVVLTFWCSFCHSCRHVERDLDKLAKQYKTKAAVIALDASGETEKTVAAFAKKRGLSLPIALNAKGTAADIFGVHVTTTTVIIDGKGVLRYCGQFGNKRTAYAEDALKAVLAGKTVQVKTTRHKG